VKVAHHKDEGGLPSAQSWIAESEETRENSKKLRLGEFGFALEE
jgi:hypothetical protein